MERLGIGYETLKAINPKLIYVSSPVTARPGLTGIAPATTSITWRWLGCLATPAAPTAGRCRLGVQVADVAGGSLHGVIGLLAAVIARQQTGQGTYWT